MTPYSFYCSGCKISHAGECPPLKNPCADIYLSCPAGFCSGHPAPTSGSTWTSRRMSLNSGQSWNSRWRYIVSHVTSDGVLTTGYDGDGNFCGDRLIDLAAWTSDGVVIEDSPGRFQRVWMLPE